MKGLRVAWWACNDRDMNTTSTSTALRAKIDTAADKVRETLALIAKAQGAADWDAAEAHARTLNADLDRRDALGAEYLALTGDFPFAR